MIADEAMRQAVMNNWNDGNTAGKTGGICRAAMLLAKLTAAHRIPLSVNWYISPRNIDLATGLIGQVYHVNNDRNRSLADLQELATILGSPMTLGPAYHQEGHKEYYEILANIDGIPVKIWSYVTREPGATAPVRAVG